jgi:DNA-binding LytR/AlgR family response regulator
MGSENEGTEGPAPLHEGDLPKAGPHTTVVVPVRVLIIEDDPVWQEVLAGSVHRLSGLALVGVAADMGSALPLLANKRPELLMLDIGLPGQSGFELLASLPLPPVVIVTTGTPDHALQAYESGVTDMLVKPFSMERFLLAMDRGVAAVMERRATGVPHADTQVKGHLSMGSGRRLVQIPLSDIRQVDAQGNHVIIHLEGRTRRFCSTMKSIEAQLPDREFVRVHRCHIISRSSIQDWDGLVVRTSQGTVPIGASYRRRLREFMGT